MREYLYERRAIYNTFKAHKQPIFPSFLIRVYNAVFSYWFLRSRYTLYTCTNQHSHGIHGTAMWCACDKGPCISFNMLLNQMAQHSKKRFKQLQVQKNTHIHKKAYEELDGTDGNNVPVQSNRMLPGLCMHSIHLWVGWWSMWDVLTVASFVLTTEGSHIKIRIEAAHDNRNVCSAFYWVPSQIKQIAHKVLMICEKRDFEQAWNLSHFQPRDSNYSLNEYFRGKAQILVEGNGDFLLIIGIFKFRVCPIWCSLVLNLRRIFLWRPFDWYFDRIIGLLDSLVVGFGWKSVTKSNKMCAKTIFSFLRAQ